MLIPGLLMPFPAYELSFAISNEYLAHSMNNIGSGGTNRQLPRRQMLTSGVETDACSGDIFKHHNAALDAEYFEAEGVPLCPACSVRDARRAGALADTRTTDVAMADILRCPLCDVHGFLLPGRKANPPAPALPSRSKDTVIDFSYALANPSTFAESIQLNIRRASGDVGDQMIMRSSCRSGTYALCIRYKCAAIGVDTTTWQVLIDEDSRRLRHRCVLRALRDQILSPEGAKTASMLPHLSSIRGAIVLRTQVGRAYMISPLRSDFVDQLAATVARTPDIGFVLRFESFEEFAGHMEFLIQNSLPFRPQRLTLPELGN